MKHKIAIMTQPLGQNYGGIIQNYALQKVLMELGHETITINRMKPYPHSKLKTKISRYKTLFSRYFLQLKVPTYLDQKNIFANNFEFLRKQINLSPNIVSTDALEKYFTKEQFTAVFVGSDQVWRPKYSPDILNFYLDFLKHNESVIKVAYAASFGTDEWEYSEDQTKSCSDLIQQFNGVSVRENSGVRLCDEYLKRKDTVHVLDPTLLLESNAYSELIGQPKKEIGLYTYVLDETEEKLLFINSCAEDLNLKVHKNQAKLKPYNIEFDKLNDYKIPPIEGWLQGFRDANYVITDSFHGTVFSILNQKPFMALVNEERGASRFESILSKLGLEDRLIYDVNDFDISKLKVPIDYKIVNLKLNDLKLESLNFLKNYL